MPPVQLSGVCQKEAERKRKNAVANGILPAEAPLLQGFGENDPTCQAK